MKSLIAKLPMHRAIGLYLGDQEIAVSQVASTPLGFVETAPPARALRGGGSRKRPRSPAAAAVGPRQASADADRGRAARRAVLFRHPAAAGRGRRRDARSPAAKGAAIAHDLRRRIQRRRDQEPVEQGPDRERRGLPAETT